MRVCLPALLMISLISEIAMAEEPLAPGDRYRKWPVAIEAQGAPIGGPIGHLGLAADVALIPQLSLTAGAGFGSAGPQMAAAIRPRIPITPQFALELTAGYSHGDYTRATRLDISGGGPGGSERFLGGSWVNVDVGFQTRLEFGATVRFFLGMSKLVACRVAEHTDGMVSPVPTDRWPLLPYGGVAVGYAFGPE